MPSSIEMEEKWWISEIIPNLLKEQKIIKDISEKNLDKFHINTISIQLIGVEEAFMMTKCYRVHVNYDYKGADGEIRFFVKKTPQVPQEVFDIINFKALFNNEILTYGQIIPALENFCKIKLNTAKLYYADQQSNSATIITEDFSNHNWMITKDRFNLSLDHVMLAVKYLGQFHAVGFALRATDKAHFEELTRKLMEARFANDPHSEYVLITKCGYERAFKATREYHKDVPEMFLNKLANLLDNAQQNCKKSVQPKEPYATLCHGDFLRNNVAYKYNDKEYNNKPTDIMMFDFQTVRVSSPMLDLSIFLALSTMNAVRQNYFHKIFEAYCEQLKETYEKITQKSVPEYLSYEPLLKEYIKFLYFSIEIASGFLIELVEPRTVSGEEMLNQLLSDEEVIEDAMSRGGDALNRELGHQIHELYQLATKYNVNIF